MTLSTYISLQLIKLKGITFPTNAMTNKSILFSLNNFLIFVISQKKNRKTDAINNLYKVNKVGCIDSTLIFIKIKELPQIADNNNREE